MTKYVKYRLVSKRHGTTLGVVISEDVYKRSSLADLALVFPFEQTRHMFQVECSPPYESTCHAFAHDFEKGVSP